MQINYNRNIIVDFTKFDGIISEKRSSIIGFTKVVIILSVILTILMVISRQSKRLPIIPAYKLKKKLSINQHSLESFITNNFVLQILATIVSPFQFITFGFLSFRLKNTPLISRTPLEYNLQNNCQREILLKVRKHIINEHRAITVTSRSYFLS